MTSLAEPLNGPLAPDHPLLAPVQLGAFAAPNRVLMAPMTRNRAEADGTPTPLMANFYAQRAGSGLMITEGTFPSALGRSYLNEPGLHTDAHQAGWARVAEAVHAKGGRIVVQLMHGGRVSHPDILGGYTPAAPSAIRPGGGIHTASGKKPFVQPRELADTELPAIVREFAESARRARRAGLDGVELHAANGYLLSQFLASGANRRTDGYGGSAANRARFVIEVARATAETIGADRVGLRMSPGNPENDIADDDADAYLLVAEAAREMGLAYLHARVAPDRVVLARLRELWPDRLVLNVGFDQGAPTPPTTRDKAAEILESGRADAVAIGRVFLANPDLVRRWTTGAALNSRREQFTYGGDAEGYTDYPALPD